MDSLTLVQQISFGNRESIPTISHQYHYDMTKSDEIPICAQNFRMGVTRPLIVLEIYFWAQTRDLEKFYNRVYNTFAI